MINKIKFLTLTIGISLLSQFSIAQSNSNMKMEKTKIDTSIVVQKTDSLATIILKKYDENSLRQTGVPLAIEHYDKTIIFNEDKKNILVSYRFNKIKFYGPTGIGIEVKGISKYPYCFDIIFDPKTNNIYQK